MKNRAIRQNKINSLLDKIDNIKWVALQARGSASKLPSDAVSFHFTLKTPRSRKDDITNADSDFVRVRFGKDVLEKLKWKAGDRIYVSNDPDDHLTFLMFKVDSTSGFKLGSENTSTCPSHACSIHFAWRKEYLPVKVANAHLVEYEIYKDKLIFRAKTT